MICRPKQSSAVLKKAVKTIWHKNIAKLSNLSWNDNFLKIGTAQKR